MIYRDLQKSIVSSCFKGKAILLIGARQVGKTTLLKEAAKQLDIPLPFGLMLMRPMFCMLLQMLIRARSYYSLLASPTSW